MPHWHLWQLQANWCCKNNDGGFRSLSNKQTKNQKGFKVAIYTLLCPPMPCRNNLRWVIVKKIITVAAWSGKIVRNSRLFKHACCPEPGNWNIKLPHISWSLHMKWILDVLHHKQPITNMFFVKKYVMISFLYDKNHSCFERFKPSRLCAFVPPYTYICICAHIYMQRTTYKQLHTTFW